LKEPVAAPEGGKKKRLRGKRGFGWSGNADKQNAERQNAPQDAGISRDLEILR
jgi:hypothetical protein